MGKRTWRAGSQCCGRDDSTVQSRFCRHDGQARGTVGVTKMISSSLSIERGLVPLGEALGVQKRGLVDGDTVLTALDLGICLGD